MRHTGATASRPSVQRLKTRFPPAEAAKSVHALRQTAGALRRPVVLLRRRLASARSEAGFALIEVMVSAALLAVVGIGIYNGIDGPAAISGTDRLRSVASGVAVRENERLHSLSFDELQQNQIPPETVTLRGINFTATSTTRWISDASATESCTNSNTSADYLALTTTVTWPGMGTHPTTIRSIQSPPTGTGTNLRGSLSVQITDQAVPGNPVTDVPVTIDGPTRITANTNSDGCAIFPYIPVGNYHGTFQQTGWVDPAGNSAGAFDTTVTGNNTTVVSKQYAQASAVNVQFEDSAGNNATWSSASLVSSGMQTPKILTSSPTGSLVNALNSGYSLFPDPSGYGAWAGDCPDPSLPSPQGYGVTRKDTVSVTPGNASTVRVRMPTLTITAKNGTTLLSGANVYITPLAACSDPGPAPLSPTKAVPSKIQTSATGVANVPLPYGDYSVCVDANIAGTNRRRIMNPVTNRAPAGSATSLDVSNAGGGTRAVC